jgi:inosine/xanthosine triphosphate pyrophosphatase family protein
MTRILLATGNPAKQARLAWLVEGSGLHPVTPGELGIDFDPAETTATHQEVAAAKAVAWSERSGVLTIASDGGARIPALGASWNSIFTRRAAGPGAGDRDRADHLLALMRGTSGHERDVTWVEGVAVARDGQLLGSWQAEGAVGQVVETYDPAQVEGGFWFPALIRVPRFYKVYAELTPAERDQVDDGWNALQEPVRAFLATLACKGEAVRAG